MEEKRKSGRFKIYQMIQMSYGKENFISCEAVNISEGGILCKTNGEIDSNSTFFLMFEIPLKAGNYEIQCDSMVARSVKVDDGWEVGLAFVDMLPDDKSKLGEFINGLKEAQEN